MTVALIACCKEKAENRRPAHQLYQSALFRKSYEYAKANHDQVYILSAKFGLIHPDTPLWPYDTTLNNMNSFMREIWATDVFHQICQTIPKSEKILIYAGKHYRHYLMRALQLEGYSVEVPLQGLGIGQQLAWYKERLSSKSTS